MIWQHEEGALKEFLKIVNSCHLTIKVTAEYSLDKNNCLDVEVIRRRIKLLTDLYIKSTDTHQYSEFSSCHVYHFKKSLPYSQALRFNRICSENRFFDNRCNQLECWLKDRGYNEKFVKQQILKSRTFTREDLLNQDSKTKARNKLVFNFTYHPAFSKLKHILLNNSLLLTPDAQHLRFFLKCLLPVLRGGKVLKIFWLGQKFPLKKKQMENLVVVRETLRSLLFLEEKDTFTNKEGSDTYQIREGVYLDCNTENIVDLITCKKCKKQYV